MFCKLENKMNSKYDLPEYHWLSKFDANSKLFKHICSVSNLKIWHLSKEFLRGIFTCFSIDLQIQNRIHRGVFATFSMDFHNSQSRLLT